MKTLIAHRGNMNGPNHIEENSPEYIDKAILNGFDVEVDIWAKGPEKIYLGHDLHKTYEIDFDWLQGRSNKLWLHCKNFEALSLLSNYSYCLHYFWHENDRYTLTSRGYIWEFPTWMYPVSDTYLRRVLVLPENNSKLDVFFSVECPFDYICSDYVIPISRMI
jgi:hypothetical protein